MSGIRFFVVVWSFNPAKDDIETTIEAAHSRRYLYDQIKKGLIYDGRTRFFKIQEVETPAIELPYLHNLFAGKATKKDRESRVEQNAYVLQLVKNCAARVIDEEGNITER